MSARVGGGGSDGLVVVVTTIQEPTRCMRQLAAALGPYDAPLLAVGDRKGPDRFDLPGAELVTIEAQRGLPLELARALPEGHYARKNIGYLLAQRRGASCVFETDDDNAPLTGWRPRSSGVAARPARGDADSGGPAGGPRWFNVYRLFSEHLLWPRGFPLDRVRDGVEGATVATEPVVVESPIQQGLADGAPDVDAVWRLLLERDIRFDPGASVHLEPGLWCPFNSQCTWWWPAAYPLMYLPSHCSFRMTDIWRSFVAQRCLWELGVGVVFHAAEVEQERNPHDLMRDFSDEVPGYTRNHALAARLEALSLRPGPDAVGENLRRCYEALVDDEFFPGDELPLVDAWLADQHG